MKDRNILKAKLSKKSPSKLKEIVFSKIEVDKEKPWFVYSIIGVALSLVLIIFTFNYNNSVIKLEDGFAEFLEYQVLIENQELFSELDLIDLEDEDWDYLLDELI